MASKSPVSKQQSNDDKKRYQDFVKRNGGPKKLFYKSNGQLDRERTFRENVPFVEVA